jgi:hypothetical protein
MTSDTMVNWKFTDQDLNELERKVRSNCATAYDYQRLDGFLATRGINNYLLTKMKRYDIDSYREYKSERDKASPYKNKAVDGALLWIVLGAISALKDFLANNR